MLKTNEKNIVEFILQCNPGPPKTRGNWAVDRNGEPFILPSIGGITVNIQVGDTAFGWEGDHVEPGVSCIGDTHKPFEHPNTSLQIFACSGNKAKMISGEAKDAEGVVIGHHGGSEHLIVDFPQEAKEKMTYEDKVVIFAKGQGLKLVDYPDMHLMNLSPELLSKMKIEEANGKLKVPVTTLIPAAAMGSGIGVPNNYSGDYDIVTGDPKTMEEYKLADLRFGDIVAVLDHDTRYGIDYRQGAITIGIIVHSDCKIAGHGPGMTVLMTCPKGDIEPVIDPTANIADYYGIGTQTAK